VAARARHVPVRKVTHGDSRSLTEQPRGLLTCDPAGAALVATTFASRESRISHPLDPHSCIGEVSGSAPSAASPTEAWSHDDTQDRQWRPKRLAEARGFRLNRQLDTIELDFRAKGLIEPLKGAAVF
jgi:hypothetical protein